MKLDYDVIIVGGGPAGSTAAAYLAMHGHKTLLLERTSFPRHRIGESLLPSMMPVLEDFDLVDECLKAGFVKKTGGTFIWGKTRTPWHIRFGESLFLPASFAFHVDRAVFDKILLDNARRRGVEVRMNAAVTGVLIQRDDRVNGVSYRDDQTGAAHSLRAAFVVDASGSASVIGKRVTTRHYDDKMRQVALYRYFKNVKGPRGFMRGHIVVESCPKGWFWYIPMNSPTLGELSLGLVTGQEFKDEIKRVGAQAFYEEALQETQHIRKLLGPGARRVGQMRGVRDWAYTAEQTAGPGYYLAGDAAAFLDPLLSTGVSLAMLAGYSASVCIHTALQDPGKEEDAAEFYGNNYKQMYEVTRDFLHYFYAGNVEAHRDELFWKARSTLKFGDNIGAKQAFSFFVNTIPGNPHPAVQKQIPMFQQFMDNLDHPMDAMAEDAGIQNLLERSKSLQSQSLFRDDAVPLVNGKLETTWVIDRETHALKPVRGITYDKERPVFSSTSSWLLGRNLAVLDDQDCQLLELMDGEKSWRQIVGEYASGSKISLAAARERVAPILDRLRAENFVLTRAD